MKNASVTIGRRHRGGDLGDTVTIEIRDPVTRSKVIELEMTPEQFALCVTGLSETPATVTRMIAGERVERLGKRRETRKVSCGRAPETVYSDDPEEAAAAQRRLVVQDFTHRFEPDGWELWRDGLDMAQRPGQHVYVIARYVE